MTNDFTGSIFVRSGIRISEEVVSESRRRGDEKPFTVSTKVTLEEREDVRKAAAIKGCKPCKIVEQATLSLAHAILTGREDLWNEFVRMLAGDSHAET